MARNSEHITGNFKLINQVNNHLILDAIRRSGQISRADLARTSGLLPATVGTIVADLIEQGIVVESKEGPTGVKSVGRPARMIELDDQARGREDAVREIRNEIKLLARTIAAIAEEEQR